MSELELKIEKLIKDQILITESEAQDLATLICELPEIKGGRVGDVVVNFLADTRFARSIFMYLTFFWLGSSFLYIINGQLFNLEYLFRVFLAIFCYAVYSILRIFSQKHL